VKTLLQALAIGTAVTLLLFGLGYVAAEHNSESLSYALYWQAYLLNALLPCNMVFRGEFLCQSMAVAKFTFFSGIPLGILIYSTAAWLVLRLRARAEP
jgi:hypothetical protein